MSDKGPVVSTIVITYNQERYIGQALQSIIDQKADFLHEVIVADDFSQDDTQNIIIEFAKKHPNVIKPILRNKNIGAWENFTDAIQKANGEYIALCEGDDYWTNNNKLQKQVDFLRKNSGYSLCFHPVLVHYENNELEDAIFPEMKTGFTLENLLKSNYIQTNSVMYRRRDYTKIAKNIMPGDWYLHLYHASFGKIGFINDIMSTYRRHSAGLWWQTASGGDVDSVWKKYGFNHLILYAELMKIYGGTKKYRDIIDKNISGTIAILDKIDRKSRTKLVDAYVKKYMEGDDMFLSLARSVGRMTELHEQSVQEMQQTINKLQERNNLLSQQNYAITQSLSWKVTKPLRDAKRIVKKKRNE